MRVSLGNSQNSWSLRNMFIEMLVILKQLLQYKKFVLNNICGRLSLFTQTCVNLQGHIYFEDGYN